MATKIWILALVFCLVGCKRSFYYTHLPKDNVTPLALDGDYTHYARKLYRINPDSMGQGMRLNQLISVKDSLKITDSIRSRSVTDKSFLAPNIKFKMVEIEHLYRFGDDVLYMTTTPSKYQLDLADKYLLSKKYANGFYYNTFFFGRVELDGQQLTCRFTDKDAKHYSLWRFDKKGKVLSLQTIERYTSDNKFVSNILVAPTVSDDIEFEEMENDSVATNYPIKSRFKHPKFKYNTADSLSQLQGIYFRKVKKGKYSLYLTYDKNLSGNYKTIRFTNNRIKNSPECIQGSK